MSFRVKWTDEADADLDRIWYEASDRDAISSAVIEIDRKLTRDPEAVGESREPGERVVFWPPIGVSCRIDVDEKKVSVAAVWWIVRGRS